MTNRGYYVDVIPDNYSVGNEIIVLGNYSKSNYNATDIVSVYGIAPTVRENHGQVTGILVNDTN